MRKLSNKMVSFNEFCIRAKKLIFGYEKVDTLLLLDLYDNMVEAAERADEAATQLMLDLGIPQESIDRFDKKEYADLDQILAERIDSGTNKFIKKGFKNRSMKKDGYCLREKLVGTAVQMVNDENMLGFISQVDDDAKRFVWVDFGGAEGAVKIDVEELIF